jgi:hypothetical protein
VKINVELEPRAGKPPKVSYRWDADTEILSANIKPADEATGLSGSVGIEGVDGSWLILDVNGGRINAVEVAVWPEIQERPSLTAPAKVEESTVLIPAKSSKELRAVEVATSVTAEADQNGKTFRFRIGQPRETRSVRLASDILLDIDGENHVAGLWLLNVPPCPSPS